MKRQIANGRGEDGNGRKGRAATEGGDDILQSSDPFRLREPGGKPVEGGEMEEVG